MYAAGAIRRPQDAGIGAYVLSGNKLLIGGRIQLSRPHSEWLGRPWESNPDGLQISEFCGSVMFLDKEKNLRRF